MKLPPKKSHLASPRFLDREELAQRWSTSISTIKRREKCGELKATKLGGRIIRYSMEHIQSIEKAGTAEA